MKTKNMRKKKYTMRNNKRDSKPRNIKEKMKENYQFH